MIKKEDLIHKLHDGLSILEQNEKYALLLKYYEDLNNEEICEVMEIDLMECINLLTIAKIKMLQYTTIFKDIDKKTETKIKNDYG